jgi:hypothetical protein
MTGAKCNTMRVPEANIEDVVKKLPLDSLIIRGKEDSE